MHGGFDPAKARVLELQLQGAISCLVLVLGNEPGLPGDKTIWSPETPLGTRNNDYRRPRGYRLLLELCKPGYGFYAN